MMDDSDDSASHQLHNSTTESLEELDWDGLFEVCKEKDEKLNLAGEYGLKLHEQLLESQSHIDEMRSQHEAEIEKYIQELFELRGRLDLKEKTLLSQQHEFEAFQKQASKNNDNELEEVRNQCWKDVNVIKKEKDAISGELEQTQLREKHTQEKLIRLEEKIQEMQVENQRKAAALDNPPKNENMFELEEKICLLEDEVEQKNVKLTELQNETQSVTLELRNKMAEANSLKKELEEVEIRSTSYFNHLQQAREETNEVKSELDLLKAEIRGSGHLQKGNSLFGEVEDKRAAMEQKLLSMQVKYESLQKAYAFVKSQLHNMKTQVVALLQMNSGRADGERISNLERAVSQAKAENLALSKKLKEVESNQNLSTEGIQALAKTLPHFETNKDMVNFLSIQLNDNKAKLSKLREELDQTYMVKLAESDKLQTAETKLHETAVLAEKYKNQNMQLRLKLEETKGKLQAETQKRILVEKKFNYDSTGDVIPVGVLSEENVKEKKALPYTLAKAKEKEQKAKEEQLRKTQFQQWNSPSVNFKDMNLKLNRASLTKTPNDNVLKANDKNRSLGRTPLVNNMENRIITPSSDIKRFCQDVNERPRKVSFKEEPETITSKDVVPDQSTILEDTENLPDGIGNEEDSEIPVFATSKVKETVNNDLSKQLNEQKLSKNEQLPKGVPMTQNDDDNECKMQ